MKYWICLLLLVLMFIGCVGKIVYRETCVNQLDVVWKELSIVEVEGFVGIVSYSKVLLFLIVVKI